MARTTSGSGPISAWAPGQENFKYNVLFDQHSTNTTSHEIIVDNNFVRIAAFNLAPGDTVTIEQITGLGAGSLTADYAPISGQVKLFYNSATDQRTSYILERPGRYRAVLSSGLGSVHVYAIQYFIENEASQDVADALYAVINELASITPCTFGAKIPRDHTAVNNAVGLDSGNCLVDFELVSPDVGNQVSLHANGVYVPLGAGGGSTPCTMGALIPSDPTAQNNVLSLDGGDCIVDQQLVSSGSGNLIQLHSDGIYYGILPPVNFINQYVSSSTGDDANAGTIGSPLKTMQKAISNLPDGTQGNVFLYAGDTFPTYSMAIGETINTLTFLQSLNNTLQVDSRVVTFRPYNDPAIADIQAWNAAHGSNYNPYIVQEINFPIVTITQSIPMDSSIIVPIAFNMTSFGVLLFLGCNIISGEVPGVGPSYQSGGFIGGKVFFEGGNISYSNIPLLGGGSGTQELSINNCIVQDHGSPSTPSLFYEIAPIQVLCITVTPIASGGVYLVTGTATYHLNGDNAESAGVLDSISQWPGIVIYSTATRAFKHLVSSIAIA